MKQRGIRLSLTRRDAATLMTVLGQAIGDEPGMLVNEDARIANKIAERLYKLLQPRKHKINKEL